MSRWTWAGLLPALLAMPVAAFEYEWGNGVGLTWKNLVSVGADLRMQQRDDELVGKLNVDGQQTLCNRDDCLSLTGDPAPNQRLVDARGAYFGANGDNGDLNYDQYDLVAAVAKLNTDLSLHYGDWLARVHGVLYYDPINADFDEHHPNALYQPARTRRDDDIVSRYAQGGELYEAFLQYNFQWLGERDAVVTVGSQIVRWGESNLLALNSISEINPPSYRSFHTPGAEFNEVFKPVPAITLAGSLSDTVSMELFYQLAWESAEADPAGSFFSFTDFLGGKNLTANVGLGQFPEDPDKRFRFHNFHLSKLSSSTLTVPVRERDARDDGQYGLRLSHFADWLNGGTDLSAYFLNYHSRLPYASLYAADDSCARDSTTITDAYVDCRGFNGTLPNPIYGQGREPLPVDTVRAVIEYPEDIQLYGLSFNTNLGSWSLAGEYAYRPNLPLLISLQDLFFAAAQPAVPAQQLSFAQLAGINDLSNIGPLLGAGAANLDSILANPGETLALLQQFPGLADIVIPSATEALPAYVTRYRGIDRVQAHQYIRGWERFDVGQFGLTAIRAFPNLLGADQIVLLTEAGFTHVIGMPSKDRLQFETFYLNSTHASGGADGSGQPGGRPPSTLRFNPTQQTKGFADDFAWGLRSILRGEYNDLLFGWNYRPTLMLAWDVQGTAPQPLQNFVEGRKEITLVNDVQFTQAFAGRVGYQWFTGAGDRNSLRDRDNLSLSVSYSF